MSDLRPDLKAIAGLIEPNVRLLDLGCDDGALLAWLATHKGVDGRGVEMDAKRVQAAIARGVPVIHADIESELSAYADQSYDVVVLSQTLQAMDDPKRVLAELMRIGKKVIVSIPNFGHWKVRLDLLLRGQMPVNKTLNHSWYETPNIHFCTLRDFVALCDAMEVTIEERLCVDHRGVPSRFSGASIWANLLGEQGVFVLRG